MAAKNIEFVVYGFNRMPSLESSQDLELFEVSPIPDTCVLAVAGAQVFGFGTGRTLAARRVVSFNEGVPLPLPGHATTIFVVCQRTS